MNNENQGKKQIKISLGIVISLIIVLIASIICFAMINKNKPTEQTNTTVNEDSTNPEEDEEKESENPDEEEDEQQELEISNTDFVFQFLKLENNKENMVYSPLSIRYALNMLNEGAAGDTKVQIENVIGDEQLTKYNNIDKVLSLANAVYIRDTYANEVKEDYKKTLTEKYNAEMIYDAFESANNINAWIENKTLGILKNIVDDGLVRNPDTKMLLINALAIEMDWENPFDSSDTYGEEFHLENGEKMIATMMSNETKNDSVSYYKDEDNTVLAMNLKEYDDTQLEFVAIMPEENLSDYINSFNIDEFDNIMNKLTSASKTKNGVNILIPKFSFGYNLRLKDDLMKLGIKDAFNNDLADFSEMANTKLYVGAAIHKADIDFTEKGVKAAAVTVFGMVNESIVVTPTKPEEIRIDKPFLYVIRDKDTGEVWFVGTVYEPNSWEEDKAEYEYR